MTAADSEDKNGLAPIDNENDPGYIEKMQQAKEKDQKEEEEIKEYLKPFQEKNDFLKVMAFNNPKILIVVACTAAAAFGFS